MNRVEELADRNPGHRDEKFPSSKHLVPLQEIIAESFSSSPKSKKVQQEYADLMNRYGGEFNILLDMSSEELAKSINPKIVDGINRVRAGKIEIEPGYDGVYGKVKVFGEESENTLKAAQTTLF